MGSPWVEPGLVVAKRRVNANQGRTWVSFDFGEVEVAVFSAKRWDRRNRADLIESATPFHDVQVMGSYRGSNPLRLTVLASKSEDYTTAPQHLL